MTNERSKQRLTRDILYPELYKQGRGKFRLLLEKEENNQQHKIYIYQQKNFIFINKEHTPELIHVPPDDEFPLKTATGRDKVNSLISCANCRI